MEKLTFFDGKQLVEVDMEITNNNNMYLKIRDGRIVVLVPKRMPEGIVKQFVSEHYAKFLKHVEKAKNKIYISLEESYFFLFGKKFYFEVIPGFARGNITKKGTKYFVQTTTNEMEEVKNIIQDFCKEKLNLYIEKRLSDFEKAMNLKKHAFKVSNKTKAWGTNYLAKGLITFAQTLAHYQKEIIDYVIFHELAHDVFADHSSNFWNEVAKWVPNYEEYRKRLRNDSSIEEI